MLLLRVGQNKVKILNPRPETFLEYLNLKPNHFLYINSLYKYIVGFVLFGSSNRSHRLDAILPHRLDETLSRRVDSTTHLTYYPIEWTALPT